MDEEADPVGPDDVRALARMLPDVVEGAHRGNPDFRIAGRVFATLWVEEERVVLRLTPEDQASLVDARPERFDPVEGAWGRRGWTSLALDAADEASLRDALLRAWRATAPAGLVAATAALALPPEGPPV